MRNDRIREIAFGSVYAVKWHTTTFHSRRFDTTKGKADANMPFGGKHSLRRNNTSVFLLRKLLVKSERIYWRLQVPIEMDFGKH